MHMCFKLRNCHATLKAELAVKQEVSLIHSKSNFFLRKMDI